MNGTRVGKGGGTVKFPVVAAVKGEIQLVRCWRRVTSKTLVEEEDAERAIGSAPYMLLRHSRFAKQWALIF